MKPAIPKSVVYSFVLLLILLAVNAGVSWYYTRTLHDKGGIAQSYEILDALSDSLLPVHEAETAERSYILTGDPAFLEDYQSATTVTAVFIRVERLSQAFARICLAIHLFIRTQNAVKTVQLPRQGRLKPAFLPNTAGISPGY